MNRKKMRFGMKRKNVRNQAESVESNNRFSYFKLYWLFIFGSLLGVLLEGLWCLAFYGNWETHVVTVFEPLCVLYGFGMVGCYIGAVVLSDKKLPHRFIAFVLTGSIIEIICGAILEYGLHMKAWDYSGCFMNFKGYVSLSMSLLWGFLGIAFSRAVPLIDKAFAKMKGGFWHGVCAVMSVFLAVDVAVTAGCFIRWSERHRGIEPSNQIEILIDRKFDDEMMQKRYIEWRFIT